MEFQGLFRWSKLPIHYSHHALADTIQLMIMSPSAAFAPLVGENQFHTIKLDGVLASIRSLINVNGQRRTMEWILDQSIIDKWKSEQAIEHSISSISSTPITHQRPSSDMNKQYTMNLRAYYNNIKLCIASVRMENSADPRLASMNSNRRELRTILQARTDRRVDQSSDDDSSDELVDLQRKARKSGALADQGLRQLGEHEYRKRQELITAQNAMAEEYMAREMEAQRQLQMSASKIVPSITLLLAIAYSSADHVATSGATLSAVRDRARCVQFEQATGDRVITFSDHMSSDDAETHRHFQGQFSTREIRGFVELVRRSAQRINRIYLDYIGMPIAQMEIAYRSILDLLWRMLVAGIINNKTEIFVPNFAAMRNLIMSHNWVQSDSAKVMHRIEVQPIPSSQNELYNITDRLWDSLDYTDAIIGDDSHDDQLPSSAFDATYPFLKLNLAYGKYS